LQTTYWI